jgi:hypothetical protein
VRDDAGGRDKTEGPTQEIVGVGLGYRMVFSEQAEVWTVRGLLRDGTVARDDIGELSFVLIPGTSEPATAVTGFVAPSPPYVLALSEDALWKQVRNMLVQLGYDQDGFYASIGIGGKYAYYEEYDRHGH